MRGYYGDDSDTGTCATPDHVADGTDPEVIPGTLAGDVDSGTYSSFVAGGSDKSSAAIVASQDLQNHAQVEELNALDHQVFLLRGDRRLRSLKKLLGTQPAVAVI